MPMIERTQVNNPKSAMEDILRPQAARHIMMTTTNLNRSKMYINTITTSHDETRNIVQFKTNFENILITQNI